MSEPEIIEKNPGRAGARHDDRQLQGLAFDLPVLRYRSMVYRLSAPSLERLNAYHRFGEKHVDLGDKLSSYSFSTKATLNGICKALDLPGKLAGIDGSQVETLVNEARFAELAAYVEADCIATAQVFLRWERLTGALGLTEQRASEHQMVAFISERAARPPLRLVQPKDERQS